MSQRLRAAAARSVSATGGYQLAQWALGRFAGGFILAFHDLAASRFVAQIEALAPNRPIPVSELIDRHQAGKSTSGLFAITFDDGVATTVREISHACLERSWPVTFYLPTGYLDEGGMPFQRLRSIQRFVPPSAIGELETAMRTKPRVAYERTVESWVERLLAEGKIRTSDAVPPAPISWAEVTALARNESVDFQSHGVSHSAVSGLEENALERELRDSRDRIAAYTQRPCRHFCYPYGSPDSIGAHAPAIVARYYDSATTLSRGRLRGHANTLLPRIPIYAQDVPTVARLKILTT